jgi:hypothetical protein
MTPSGPKKVSTSRLVILLVVMIIGFAIARFFLLAPETGYKQAGRKAVTQPATTSSIVHTADPAGTRP